MASDFVGEAVQRETSKPVLTFPLPVLVPPPPSLARADLGLPEDAFFFLFVFDFFSTLQRKNPLGLIDAFTRAFPEPGRALLYLKSINGSAPRQTWRACERRRQGAGHRALRRLFEGDRLTALTALCDCYVSLHRSEGFGLTIAEAMSFGKPAIATGYSGNLAFMDAESSYLVPFELATLDEAVGPYPAGTESADPDLDEAARLMRHWSSSRTRLASAAGGAKPRSKSGSHSNGRRSSSVTASPSSTGCCRSGWLRDAGLPRRGILRLRSEPLLERSLPRPGRPLVPDSAAAPTAALHDAPARARDAARPRDRGPRRSRDRLDASVRRLEERLRELNQPRDGL